MLVKKQITVLFFPSSNFPACSDAELNSDKNECLKLKFCSDDLLAWAKTKIKINKLTRPR